MHVFLSTVIRGAPLERAGELIALDWDSKRVLGRAPLALAEGAKLAFGSAV